MARAIAGRTRSSADGANTPVNGRSQAASTGPRHTFEPPCACPSPPSSPCFSPCPPRRLPTPPRASRSRSSSRARSSATGRCRPTRRRSRRSWTSSTARPTAVPPQPLRATRARHGDRCGRGHADRPPARLPLGRRGKRASRSPSRSTRSSRATSTTRRRASRSTRARTSTRPTPSTARASAAPTSDPNDPCQARRSDAPADDADPVKGLDTNDELAFMASRRRRPGAGRRTAAGGHRGVQGGRDRRPDRARRAHALRLRDDAPAPTVRSPRSTPPTATCATSATPTPTRFELSESTLRRLRQRRRTGPYCDAHGNVVAADGTPTSARRPLDYATVTTPRYRFRYDGRWLMTAIQISPDGGKTYGPDLVDRWKARAFAQDPGSQTPCCGFEEEDTNWGGSRTLLGERVGPVRAIRETWGADSGTNVDPPRDLLPRRGAPEDLAARARRSRRSTASTPSGTSTPARVTQLLQLAQRPSGVADRRAQRRGVRQPRRPVQPATTTPTTPSASRPGLPRRSTGDRAVRRASPYHLSVDTRRPDLRRRQRRARLERDARARTARSSTAITIDSPTDADPGRRGAVGRPRCPTTATTRASTTAPAPTPGPKRQAALGRRAAHDRRRQRRAAAGTPRTALPDGSDTLLPGLDRARTACTCCSWPTPTTRARRCRSTEIVSDWTDGDAPGLSTGNVGEQYGRSFEKPLVATVGAGHS